MNKIVFFMPSSLSSVDGDFLNFIGTFESAVFFYANEAVRKAIESSLSELDGYKNITHISFASNNKFKDEELYLESEFMASLLYNIIASRGLLGDAIAARLVKRSFTVNAMDRFAGLYRPFMEFFSFFESSNFDEVVLVPSKVVTYLTAFDYLSSRISSAALRVYSSHIPEKVLSIARSGNKKTIIKTSYMSFDYGFDRSRLTDRSTILYIGNFRDPQYRKMADAVLPLIVNNSDVLLVDVTGSDLSDYSRQDGVVCAVKQKGSLNKLETREISLVSESIDEFVRLLELLPGYLNKTNIFADYLRVHLAAMLGLMRSSSRSFSCLSQNVSCIVVSPGRTVEAGIAVAIGRNTSVPSLEIQSGTISPSERFVCPNTDFVAAIDDFSSRVYSEFLGFPQDNIFVTGSPKNDVGLRKYRGISKESARQKLGFELTAESLSGSFFTLASQPVGLKMMGDVCDLLFRGLAEFSTSQVTVLIAQHPNESESYRALYEQLSMKYELQVRIVQGNSHLAVLASDIVFTYYSTIGIEAYALDRPVVCLNPYTDRPPYDLSSLNVAKEVNSHEEITIFLSRYFEGYFPMIPVIDFLYDGNADEKVSDLIENLKLGPDGIPVLSRSAGECSSVDRQASLGLKRFLPVWIKRFIKRLFGLL